jgi:hypothetical protein
VHLWAASWRPPSLLGPEPTGASEIPGSIEPYRMALTGSTPEPAGILFVESQHCLLLILSAARAPGGPRNPLCAEWRWKCSGENATQATAGLPESRLAFFGQSWQSERPCGEGRLVVNGIAVKAPARGRHPRAEIDDELGYPLWASHRDLARGSRGIGSCGGNAPIYRAPAARPR